MKRFQSLQSFLKAGLFCLALACLSGCIGGVGGESLVGVPGETGEIGNGPAINPSLPPPLGDSQGSSQGGSPGNSSSAASPDVMGPKGDDVHMGDNDWTAPAVISQDQRLRCGPSTAEEATVIDPDQDPHALYIPFGGNLKCVVEVSFKEAPDVWTSDLVGPYVRLVHLPYDAQGNLSLNGSFLDLRLNGKDAEGFNAVFQRLNVGPGELSLWYYESAAMPMKNQTWEAAIFFPPPGNVPGQEALLPISFNEIWNFAAEPFTRHLGRLKIVALSYSNQPNLNHDSHPVSLSFEE